MKPKPAKLRRYLIPASATPSQCRSCRAPIIWIYDAQSGYIPISMATIYDGAGLSHFVDCPQREAWSTAKQPPLEDRLVLYLHSITAQCAPTVTIAQHFAMDVDAAWKLLRQLEAAGRVEQQTDLFGLVVWRPRW